MGVTTKEASDLKKRAGFSDINPDALPSSVVQKIIGCLDKRLKAVAAIKIMYEKLPRDLQTSDTAKTLVWNVLQRFPYSTLHSAVCVGPWVVVSLRMFYKLQDMQNSSDLSGDFSAGCVDGFSRELLCLHLESRTRILPPKPF